VSAVQELKAFSEIISISDRCSKVTEARLSQQRKQPEPMNRTEAGIQIDSRDEQKTNAHVLNLTTIDGFSNITVARKRRSVKAYRPSS
jgi:hypothetical protein